MATDPAAEPMIGPAVPPPAAAAGDAAEPAGLRWELLEEGTTAPERTSSSHAVQADRGKRQRANARARPPPDWTRAFAPPRTRQ